MQLGVLRQGQISIGKAWSTKDILAYVPKRANRIRSKCRSLGPLRYELSRAVVNCAIAGIVDARTSIIPRNRHVGNCGIRFRFSLFIVHSRPDAHVGHAFAIGYEFSFYIAIYSDVFKNKRTNKKIVASDRTCQSPFNSIEVPSGEVLPGGFVWSYQSVANSTPGSVVLFDRLQ